MLLSKHQREKRKYWINNISTTKKSFGDAADCIEHKISEEIENGKTEVLVGHLRLCGVIPEKFKHDSSEEKLYSKYTDIVIHEAFKSLGFKSLVLKERAGVADVECTSEECDFVADAKAFRLSRTAKNQKDFKIQAMDNWKNGKPYAILIAPIFQLPSRNSQIYQQSAARSVCISTYTHLAVFSRYAAITNQAKARRLLKEILLTIDSMNPSKSAIDYWQAINRVILGFDTKLKEIWNLEKKATLDAIIIARKEGLEFLATERKRIMNLSKEQAIKEVLRQSKIAKKVQAIETVKDNGLLNVY